MKSRPVAPAPSVTPVAPDALRLRDALARSAPLAALRMRMNESNRRFDAIRPCLPEALVAHVRPGPLDDQGWSLLAANPAVAAKLRQLGPRFEAELDAGGWSKLALRIKVGPG